MAEATTQVTAAEAAVSNRKTKKAPDEWYKSAEAALEFQEKENEPAWTVMMLSCEHGPTVFALANPVHAPTVTARYARQYLGVKCDYEKKGNKVLAEKEAQIAAKDAEIAALKAQLEGKPKKK